MSAQAPGSTPSDDFFVHHKHVSQNQGVENHFGSTVAMDGDVLVAADDLENVEVLRRNADGTWAFEAQLMAPEAGIDFGTRHAISTNGEWIAIGAAGDDTFGTNAGAVHLYKHDGLDWNYEGALSHMAPNGNIGYDAFGKAVSMEGDRMVVGSSAENGEGGKGAIHYFEYNAWLDMWLETGYIPSEGTANGTVTRFAQSLDISGEWMIAGEYGDNTNGNLAGAAHIYHFHNQCWHPHISFYGHEAGDRLGTDVSISGLRAVAGSPMAGLNGLSQSGAVTLYEYLEYSGDEFFWTETFHFIPDAVQNWDRFGTAVDLDGDLLAVGAPTDDNNGSNAGLGYFLFDCSAADLECVAEGSACDAQPNDRFGFDVAVSDGLAAIGAERDDNIFEEAGSVYVLGADDLGFSCDLTAPAAPMPDLLSDDDTGVSDSDNITQQNTPDFQSLFNAGSPIAAMSDQSLAVAGDALIWWLEVTGAEEIQDSSIFILAQPDIEAMHQDINYFTEPFEDGEYTFCSRLIDTYGNASAANCITVTIDNVDPTYEVEYDNELEAAVAGGDTTLYLDAMGAVNLIAPLSILVPDDNVAVDTILVDAASFSCADLGQERAVGFTVLDVAGNSTQDSLFVTVLDTITPTMAVQNVTVSLDSDGLGTLSVDEADAGSSDACGMLGLSWSPELDCLGDLPRYSLTSGTYDSNTSECDDCTSEIELGFDFTFYGVQYNSLWISSNGVLSFETSGSECCEGRSLTEGYYDGAIAVIHTDIDPDECGDCGIYYQTIGEAPNREFVVSYHYVSNYEDNSYRHDGQAILYEGSNVIEVFNGGLPTYLPEDCEDPMTTGISNQDGTEGVVGYEQVCGPVPPAMFIFTPDGDGYELVSCAPELTFDCSDVGDSSVVLYGFDASGNMGAQSLTVTVVDELGPQIQQSGIEVYLNEDGEVDEEALFELFDTSDNCELDTTYVTVDLGCEDVASADSSNYLVPAEDHMLLFASYNGFTAFDTQTGAYMPVDLRDGDGGLGDIQMMFHEADSGFLYISDDDGFLVVDQSSGEVIQDYIDADPASGHFYDLSNGLGFYDLRAGETVDGVHFALSHDGDGYYQGEGNPLFTFEFIGVAEYNVADLGLDTPCSDCDPDDVVSFEKLNYGTAMDTIVPHVVLARGDKRGWYNATQEGYFNSQTSPKGTLWKSGSTETPGLYTNWVEAVDHEPGDMVGDTISLWIPEGNLFFDVAVSSWTCCNDGGGFAYTRTLVDAPTWSFEVNNAISTELLRMLPLYSPEGDDWDWESLAMDMENGLAYGVCDEDGLDNGESDQELWVMDFTAEPAYMSDLPCLNCNPAQEVTFTKPDSAIGIADTITPYVALARGNRGGYYNAITQPEWNGQNAEGTLWKVGPTEEPGSYTTWKRAHDDDALIQLDTIMSLWLPQGNLFFDIETTAWTDNQEGGGFSYTRTLVDAPDYELPEVPSMVGIEHLGRLSDDAAAMIFLDGALYLGYENENIGRLTLTEDGFVEEILAEDVPGRDLNAVVAGLAPMTTGSFSVTAIDIHGNTSEQSMVVNVMDTISPTLEFTDVTLELDAEGMATLEVSDIDEGTTDGCGIDTMMLDMTAFDCSHIGDNEVTFTATDIHGNSSSETVIVTVEDNMDPTAIAQNITVYLDEEGEAMITADMVDNGSSDNCGMDTLFIDVNEFTCEDIGEVEVTLVVVDLSGNESEAMATVTVADSTAPVLEDIDAESLTVYLDEDGMVPEGQFDAFSFDDACGMDSTWVEAGPFDCSDVADGAGEEALIFIEDDHSGFVYYLPESGETAYVQWDGGEELNDDMGDADILLYDEMVGGYLLSDGNTFPEFAVIDPVTFQIVDLFLSDGDLFDFDYDNQDNIPLMYRDGDYGLTGVEAVESFGNVHFGLEEGEVTYDPDGTGTRFLLDTIWSLGDAHRDALYMLLDTSTADTNEDLADAIAALGAELLADLNTHLPDSCALITFQFTSSTTLDAELVHHIPQVQDGIAWTYNALAIDSASGEAYYVGRPELDFGTFWSQAEASFGEDADLLEGDEISDDADMVFRLDLTSGESTALGWIPDNDLEALVFYNGSLVAGLDDGVIAELHPEMTAMEDGRLVMAYDTLAINDDGDDLEASMIGEAPALHPITFYGVDDHGNVGSATRYITLLDTLSPEVEAMELDIYLDETGSADIALEDALVAATDNCGLDTVYLSRTEVGCGDLGFIELDIVAVDASGNTTMEPFEVNVLDTLAPTPVVLDTTLYLDAEGFASFNAVELDGGATDNCSASLLEIGDMGPGTGTVFHRDSTGATGWTYMESAPQEIEAQHYFLNYLLVLLGLELGTDEMADIAEQIMVLGADQFLEDFDGLGGLPQVEQPGAQAHPALRFMLEMAETAEAMQTAQAEQGGAYIEDVVWVGEPTFGEGNDEDMMEFYAAAAEVEASIEAIFNGLCSEDNNCPLAFLEFNAFQQMAEANHGGHGDWYLPSIDELIADMERLGGHEPCALHLTSSPFFSFFPGNVSVAVADADSCASLYQPTTSLVDSLIASDFEGIGEDLGDLYYEEFPWDARPGYVVYPTLFDLTNLIYNLLVIVEQDDAPSEDQLLALLGQPREIVMVRSFDGIGVTAEQTEFDCGDVGTQMVEVSFTDGSGNTATAMANITILDTISPNAAALDTTLYLDAAGMANLDVSGFDLEEFDACGVDDITVSKTDFSCGDLGENTVELTLTDVNGNSSVGNGTVTIADTISPAAIAQDLTVYLDASGAASITAEDIDNSSSDNCEVEDLAIDMDSFDCSHVGANTVTLTVTDDSDNSSTATATVTVADTISPVVTANPMLVYLDGAGEALVDSCGIAIFHDDFEGYPLNKKVQNYSDLWEAEEGSNIDATVSNWANNTEGGNKSLRLKSNGVRVALGNLMTYGSPVTLEYYNSAGSPSSSVNGQNSSAEVTFLTEGDEGLFTYTLDGNSPTSYADGLWTITEITAHEMTPQTWEKVNVVFDFDADSATVFVNDEAIAGASGPDVAAVTQIRIETSGGGWNFFDDFFVKSGMPASAEDACGIATLSIAPDMFDCDDLGDAPVVYTATDVNGNEGTANGFITVEDHIAPMTMAIADTTLYLDAAGMAALTTADVDSSSTDNCGIASLDLSQTSYGCSDIALSPISVVLTGTDASGNASTDTLLVTVLDTISPSVAASQSEFTLYLDATGNATLTENAAISDACGIASSSIDITEFSCTNVGTPTTVTISAEDNNGNTANATIQVNVVDTISPAAVAQNLTVYLDAAGAASITAADVDNGSSDACGIDNLSLDVTSFDCEDTGANTVTLTVNDVNSNSSTATATVTVLDTIRPAAVAQDLTVYLDASGAASITAADVDNGSSDICGIDTLVLSAYSFDCDALGANTVTLTATDNSENNATATATVTVLDTIRPAAVAQDLTVYLDASGAASITAEDIDNGSTDNCAVDALSIDVTSFSCTETGANNVVLTVADGSTNSSTATSVVTVLDTISPALTLAASDLTVECDGSGNSADLNGWLTANGNATATDACGIVWTHDYVALSEDCGNTGSATVTFTATDPSGNTATTSATFTIKDETNPSIDTPASNLTVECDGMGNSADLNGWLTASGNAVASDVCAGVTWTHNFTELSDECGATGSATVTFTATDACNNTATTTATFTIKDETDPSINTMASDQTYQRDGNEANAFSSWLSSQAGAAATDACSGVTWSNNSTGLSDECGSTGTETVIFTATDACNNTSTTTATFTVIDDFAPSCPLIDLVVGNDDGLDLTDNITNDNAPTIRVYFTGEGVESPEMGDVVELFINSASAESHDVTQEDLDNGYVEFETGPFADGAVTFSARHTDDCGQASIFAFLNVIINSTDPSIVLQPVTVSLDEDGHAAVPVEDFVVSSSDDLGIVDISAAGNPEVYVVEESNGSLWMVNLETGEAEMFDISHLEDELGDAAEIMMYDAAAGGFVFSTGEGFAVTNDEFEILYSGDFEDSDLADGSLSLECVTAADQAGGWIYAIERNDCTIEDSLQFFRFRFEGLGEIEAELLHVVSDNVNGGDHDFDGMAVDLDNSIAYLVGDADATGSGSTNEELWMLNMVTGHLTWLGDLDEDTEAMWFDDGQLWLGQDNGEIGLPEFAVLPESTPYDCADPACAIPDSVQFTKADYADVSDSALWDHITDDVALFRGESGSLYNALGGGGIYFKWGPTAGGGGYTANFQAATDWDANDLPGETLSLYIPEGNLFFDLEFSDWTCCQDGGGFAYERIHVEAPEVVFGKFIDDDEFLDLDDIVPAYGNWDIEAAYFGRIFTNSVMLDCGDTDAPVEVVLRAEDIAGNVVFDTTYATVIDDMAPTLELEPHTVYLNANGNGYFSESDIVGDASMDNCSYAAELSWDSQSCGAAPKYGLTSGTLDGNTSNCDDCTTPVPLGFDFTFYGVTYSQVYISSNGLLQFESSSSECCSGDEIPDNDYDAAIAVIHTDLDPAEREYSNIYYQTVGTAPNREFVVSWSQVANYSNNDISHDGQAVLYEATGVVEVYSGYHPEINSDMTTGISNQDGTLGMAAPEFVENENQRGNAYFTFTPDGDNYAMEYEVCSDFTCADVGVVNVTVTATDPSGNVTTGVVEVTVVDDVAPIVTSTPYIQPLDENGMATYDLSNAMASDACGIQSFEALTTLDCEVEGPVLGAVDFTKEDGAVGGAATDNLSWDVALTRGNNGGLYNAILQDGYQQSGPAGTLWKLGTADSDAEWTSLHSAAGGGLGNNLPGATLTMVAVQSQRFFEITFTGWTSNGNGGGFAYTRTEVPMASGYFTDMEAGEGCEGFVSETLSFEKMDGDDPTLVYDSIAPGIWISRGNNQGLINAATGESFWDNEGPSGTLWRIAGSGTVWSSFYDAFGGGIGDQILTTDLEMFVPSVDQIWLMDFTSWTSNGNGGGFAYTRTSLAQCAGCMNPVAFDYNPDALFPTPCNMPLFEEVQLVATDNNGNVTEYTAYMAAADMTAPTLNLYDLEDYTLYAGETCVNDVDLFAAGHPWYEAYDNCDVAVEILYDEINETGIAGCREFDRRWILEATDPAGNVSRDTTLQHITVVDTTAPVVFLAGIPQDVTMDLAADCTGDMPEAALVTASATDNCSDAPTVGAVTFTDSAPAYLCGDAGSYTVVRTYMATAEDACGNHGMATATQTVTFLDVTAPQITASAGIANGDVVIEEEGSEIFDFITVPNPINLTAEDACGGEVTITETETFSGLLPTDLIGNYCGAQTPEAFIDGDACNGDAPAALVLEGAYFGGEGFTIAPGGINLVESYYDQTLHIEVELTNADGTGGFIWNADYNEAFNWAEWSALGRGYKKDCANVLPGQAPWTGWEYMVMQTGGMIGTGIYAGSELSLTHQPMNYYYGLQVGAGANNLNANYGASAWFYWSGELVVNGVSQGYLGSSGDIMLDLDCNLPWSVDYGYTVTDACGNPTQFGYTVSGAAEQGGNTPTVTGETGHQPFDISIASDVKEPIRVTGLMPNPTNDVSQLGFVVSNNMRLRVDLYTMGGQLVQELYDGNAMTDVEYLMTIDADGLDAGMYQIRIASNTYMAVKKLLVTQ